MHYLYICLSAKLNWICVRYLSLSISGGSDRDKNSVGLWFRQGRWWVQAGLLLHSPGRHVREDHCVSRIQLQVLEAFVSTLKLNEECCSLQSSTKQTLCYVYHKTNSWCLYLLLAKFLECPPYYKINKKGTKSFKVKRLDNPCWNPYMSLGTQSILKWRTGPSIALCWKPTPSDLMCWLMVMWVHINMFCVFSMQVWA